MPSTTPDAPLSQGGPGEQAGPRPAAGDDGRAASQQGSPRHQPAATRDAERPSAGRHPAEPADSRPLSQSERDAASPDPRATTDGSHGEGEPPRPAPDAQAP